MLHQCEGFFCGPDKFYTIGTSGQWLGRNKHKEGEGVVVYIADPFEEEISGKEIMLWLCEYCWYGLHDDI